MNYKKLLSFLGLFAFIFISGLALLILNPQALFAHSYTHKNFEIYSNYQVNQNEFNLHLDQAIRFFQNSELYDDAYKYDLFLANETNYNKIDDRLLGKWSVARAIDNNILIKRKVSSKNGTVQNGENQFNLAYVIAHEMTHCLQAHKYGKVKFNPFRHPPMWKLEGYPEYIARRDELENPTYTLKEGIKDFLARPVNDYHNIQIKPRESTPFIYYKGRLMTEYLLDVKGWTYDDILSNEVVEDSIYNEMINWYQKQ